MDINTIQGSAAYATASAPPVDNTNQEQNLEAAKADLNADTTAAVQQAFEVTISQDAQERTNQEQLATQAASDPVSEEVELTPAVPTETPDDQNTTPEQGSGPIVNIVA